MITRNDFPADHLRNFIAYAKANPTLVYGSAGIGAASHACSILLNNAIGTNLVHVPYRGSTPVMHDLQAQRLDFGCEQSSSAVAQIQGKTVKASKQCDKWSFRLKAAKTTANQEQNHVETTSPAAAAIVARGWWRALKHAWLGPSKGARP